MADFHDMGFVLRKDPEPDSDVSDRRSRGRVRVQGLDCNLGSVLDLSGTGMRVQSTKPAEGLQPVVIDVNNQTLQFEAEVVWLRKTGFRRYLMGLRFVNMPPTMNRELAAIATTFRVRVGL